MRSIGALILNIFAALWAALALHQLGMPVWQQTCPVSVSAILIAWAFSRPATATNPEARKRIGRVVMFSSTAEGVLCSIAIIGLLNSGHADLIIPALAAIVGLHFYPLAIGLRSPIYWFTGTAMLGLGAGAACLMPATTARDALIGGGCALTLWLSGLALMLARREDSPTALSQR